MQQLNLEKIKKRRLELNLTLKDMTKPLNLKTASNYQKYENGDYKLKAYMLPALAKALNVNIEYFFKK